MTAKDELVACYKVLPKHVGGVTEENHKASQARQSVSGLRFEFSTSCLWCRSANH